MRPCPICDKVNVPFEDGQPVLACLGPAFDYIPRGSWWEARYGRISWAHYRPIEDDLEGDPNLTTTLDRFIVNRIRAWWLRLTYRG